MSVFSEWGCLKSEGKLHTHMDSTELESSPYAEKKLSESFTEHSILCIFFFFFLLFLMKNIRLSLLLLLHLAISFIMSWQTVLYE